jgi:hypothetical protein
MERGDALVELELLDPVLNGDGGRHHGGSLVGPIVARIAKVAFK